MKRIILFCTISLFLLNSYSFGQDIDALYINSKYKNSLQEFISYTFNLEILKQINFDKDRCINYMNIIKFNIDSSGKLYNIQNSPIDNSLVKANEGLDSSEKSRINLIFDSLINLTSGYWTSRIKDGIKINSKTHLLIVNYNYIGNCLNNEKYTVPVQWTYNFIESEECIISAIYQYRQFYRK